MFCSIHPFDLSERFISFILWQTCSFRHQLNFSGKHSSKAAIAREDHSLTFPPLGIWTQTLSIASLVFYRWATMLHMSLLPKLVKFCWVILVLVNFVDAQFVMVAIFYFMTYFPEWGSGWMFVLVSK